MAGIGRHYTKEFKDSTIQLALNSEKSAYQIAQDLEMSDKTLYAWLRAYKKKHNLDTNIPKLPLRAAVTQGDQAGLRRRGVFAFPCDDGERPTSA